MINWSRVLTNAVSALVTAVFVGTMVLLWTAAMSIDEKIDVANENILDQQAVLLATQETIVREITELRAQISIAEDGVFYSGVADYEEEESAPDKHEFKEVERIRINEEIDVRQRGSSRR